MVKDGEIVYPGTELAQNGELPPRKGTVCFHMAFASGIHVSSTQYFTLSR